jgi:xeroderma pigmentosum group C-complementing protein
LQLIVDLPDAVCRKTKKIDVEMMMKRRMNRVKKEYQVYMHKVHVLCWLGHGNYVSRTLNDQELLAAALSLVPSKECYPGERVDMKYLEQITTWFKDKLTLKQDKNENKYKPKLPPLKDLLISQIKSRVVTTKKYLVYIFVCMLRALGLQCRVMFNFVTLPLKPPSSELCSLSTKQKENEASNETTKPTTKKSTSKSSNKTKKDNSNSQSAEKISQLDGADDYLYPYFQNIVQLDGNDDRSQPLTRSNNRVRKTKDINTNPDDVSPPKKSRKSPSPKPIGKNAKRDIKEHDRGTVVENSKKSEVKGKRTSRKPQPEDKVETNDKTTKLLSESKIAVNEKSAPRKKTTKEENITSNDNARSRKTRSTASTSAKTDKVPKPEESSKNVRNLRAPKIIVTQDNAHNTSKYFTETNNTEENKKASTSRKRSRTATPDTQTSKNKEALEISKSSKTRTKSAPGSSIEQSKYFRKAEQATPRSKQSKESLPKQNSIKSEDKKRVSHRDLAKSRSKNDHNNVTGDLVNIIKKRVKEAKEESKRGLVAGT